MEKTDKKINRFIKVYPFHAGLTADLLFYIAIDTLFLKLVKGFTPAEIVSLNAISQLVCILLQFPLLLVIKKIGNTASIRTGSTCLLLSALLITFGNGYAMVLIGRVFHDVAGILKTAETVALENNLDLVGRRRDFVRIRTRANTVYSVITMIISFVASLMFNLNHYFPMICCIMTCFTGFVLSMIMKDNSDYNKIDRKKLNRSRAKIRLSKLIVLTIVSYAVYYSLVSSAQSEGKLFIQENLLLDFNEDNTALILGAIVCISRIIRVASNVVFAKLYEKYQAKTGIVLPVMLCMSTVFLFAGSFIPYTVLKYVVMGLGYSIILFARDPFRLFIQDAVIQNTPKEQHQTLLTVLAFGVKIVTAGMGLSFSAILLSFPMSLVIGIMIAVAVVEIVLSVFLYRQIMIGRKNAELPSEA